MADMEENKGTAPAQPPVGEVEPPDSLAALVPKRRLWPVFAVLAAVVAVVGLLVYREMTAVDPLRILVAIDLDGYWWDGSQPAAKLSDALASQLAELGFDPVRGGDPKVMRVLEKAKDPRAAAKKLGAGFVIEAHLVPEVVEHPVKGGYFEMRVDAPVTLTYLESGSASEGRVRGYTGAVKKERAMALLADAMASDALDAVIAQLLDHPAVVEITSGSDMKLLARIQPARTMAKDRAKKLADAAAAYAQLAGRHEIEGQGKVTFLSPPAAADELVGVGAGGYYVRTADVSPFFSLRSRDLVRSEALETITFRSFDPAATDAAAPKPLWKGYHVFTYPSASREGDRVALVEDLFGWAKTITMVDRSGTSKRVRVDPEHRFVDPQLSPSSRFVALYDRPSAGAQADLAVLETEGGTEVFGFHTENQSLGGFTWIDGQRLAFLYTPDAGPTEEQTLAVVDVGKQPFTVDRPLRGKRGEGLSTPSASRDGTRIVCVQSGAQRGLAVIDTASWSRRLYPVGVASWPTFSPDGAQVAFETRGEHGGVAVAVLSLASGAVKKLTEMRTDQRLPRFSADGKRVLFEVREADPVFPRARGLSRVASAAVEP